MRHASFPGGATLIQQGAAAEELLLLRSGRCAVVRSIPAEVRGSYPYSKP